MKKMFMMLVLVQCLAIAPLVNASELLTNGGFEIGTPGYWRPATFDLEDWIRYGDLNAWPCDGLIAAEGGDDNNMGVDGVITPSNMALKFRWAGTGVFQDFDASEGVSYNLSVDVYNSSIDGRANKWDAGLNVEWFDAANAKIGSTFIVDKYFGGPSGGDPLDQWINIGDAVVAPAGAVRGRFIMILSANANETTPPGYLYYDNASVQSPGAGLPVPADKSAVDYATTTQIGWDNPTSVAGDDLTCDVYWYSSTNDSEPNSADFDTIATLIVDDLAVASESSSTVDLSTLIPSITIAPSTNYYWRVDVTDTTAGEVIGDVWSFSTESDPPLVDAGIDQNAWIKSGTVSVTMDGSASDDGLPSPPSLTTTWSTTDAGVSFTNANDPLTDVTFLSAGTYTLTLSADDTEWVSTDDTVVTVYAETDTRLVALYEFETDASDSVGGHDGTFVGAAAVDGADVKVGSGSLLLSSGDDQIEILDSGVADPNWAALSGAADEVVAHWADLQEVSVTAWVKGSLTGSYSQFVRKGRNYALIRQQETSNAMWKVSAWVSPDVERAARDNDTINVKLDDGNWHHLAGTWDGEMVRIYVDGILERETDGGIYAKSDPDNDGLVQPLPIGGNYLIIGGAVIGNMDQVRLYDRGLTAERVLDEFIADGGSNSCRQQYTTMDFTQDCVVDIADFAAFAAEWLDCIDITGVACN